MLKFFKKIHFRLPKFVEVKNIRSGSFKEIPDTVEYQLWRKRQKGKIPLAW
ncbi:MAG: hypothetical protein ABFD50_22750 [Smithella sp.]